MKMTDHVEFATENKDDYKTTAPLVHFLFHILRSQNLHCLSSINESPYYSILLPITPSSIVNTFKFVNNSTMEHNRGSLND